MSNTMMLYLFTRLDNIIVFCVTLVSISSIAILVLGIAYALIRTSSFMNKDDEKQLSQFKKWIIRLIVFTMFFSVLIIFIPSTKEVAFIYLGGKLADYGSNSEDLKQIPDKAIKMLNNKMEQYLEEQKKEIDKIKEGK